MTGPCGAPLEGSVGVWVSGPPPLLPPHPLTPGLQDAANPQKVKERAAAAAAVEEKAKAQAEFRNPDIKLPDEYREWLGGGASTVSGQGGGAKYCGWRGGGDEYRGWRGGGGGRGLSRDAFKQQLIVNAVFYGSQVSISSWYG